MRGGEWRAEDARARVCVCVSKRERDRRLGGGVEERERERAREKKSARIHPPCDVARSGPGVRCSLVPSQKPL